MKLKDYARQQGVSYRTAWRWWKAGKLPGRQMDTGTIPIETEPASASSPVQRVAVYARVSSAENPSNLESQAQRLVATAQRAGTRWRRWSKRLGPA
jgi:putative resolvase